MPKIDLVTGFLGSGKTTFIRKYAQYLIEEGKDIGILENDYGAVNVDTMLLGDLEGENCELEMVAGGCDYDCHRRRFKTKLIAMGMEGYERVLVEPSGIYDTDEFFDVLYEDPLDRWYTIGTVIAIVDAGLEEELSDEADYLLACQIADAGAVVLSRADRESAQTLRRTVEHLNRVMARFGCSRRFCLDKDASAETEKVARVDRDGEGEKADETVKATGSVEHTKMVIDTVQTRDTVWTTPWDELTKEDFDRIMGSGYRAEDHIKIPVDRKNSFSSLYYMHVNRTPEELKSTAQALLDDPSCGHVFRIKGFLPTKTRWVQLNATRNSIHMGTVAQGQEVIIVIGENLQQKQIDRYIGRSAGQY